MDLSSDC
jgi:WD40 repeat protein